MALQQSLTIDLESKLASSSSETLPSISKPDHNQYDEISKTISELRLQIYAINSIFCFLIGDANMSETYPKKSDKLKIGENNHTERPHNLQYTHEKMK